MGWIRRARRALAAGREIQVRPKGAWILWHFSDKDTLTLAPVNPPDLRRRDLVFIEWKNNNLVLRLVLDTRDGEVLVGSHRSDDGDWLPANGVLGRVIRIDKEYTCRDPINPDICYEWLSAGAPPSEVSGDYGHATFHFYARYDYWDFVLSSDLEFTADELQYMTKYVLEAVQASDNPFPEDEVAAFKRCFVRTGQYGKQGDFEASYMPEEEVMRIIRECISEYEREAAS